MTGKNHDNSNKAPSLYGKSERKENILLGNILKLRKKNFSSDLARNIAILLTGTILAQIIPFVFSPILSRLYSPQDFGLLSIITSLSGILSVIVCGRFEQSIVLPEKDEAAISLISIAHRLALITTTVVLLILFFFNEHIAALLNIAQSSLWLFFVPLLMLFIGIQQCFNYWLIRKKAFKKISINKVVQTTSIAIISLLLGLKITSNGLLVGYIIGCTILLIFSFYQALKTGYSTKATTSDTRNFNMRKYSDFPLYNTFPALLNAIASSLPIFYISHFYNQSITGYYNYTRLIILVPLSLIAMPMSQVYFERIVSKARNRETILFEIKRVFTILSLLALLFIIIIFCFGPWLFGFIFGNTWKISGEYARVLIFSYAIQFVITPLSTILTALNRIKLASLWPTIYFGLMLLLSFYKGEGINKFISLLTIIEVISYLTYGFLIYWAVKEYERKITII